ncbi:hypothetical protein Ct61P_15496 [Colletotrichum tofieldiae]|nr:hypothetical protein Ct61P_15496 [Colletotrichum tofieldiae]
MASPSHLPGSASGSSSNNSNNNSRHVGGIPSEGGMNDLINQYPMASFPTHNVINPWVQGQVPAGRSLPADALLHHVDTHASRLSAALQAQGSAPPPRRRRLQNNLQYLRDAWPQAEWYPAACPPGLPPKENVVTAMKTLTKLWLKEGRSLDELWREDANDAARSGLLIAAVREKRAVRLTEDVVTLALRRAKALFRTQAQPQSQPQSQPQQQQDDEENDDVERERREQEERLRVRERPRPRVSSSSSSNNNNSSSSNSSNHNSIKMPTPPPRGWSIGPCETWLVTSGARAPPSALINEVR